MLIVVWCELQPWN